MTDLRPLTVALCTYCDRTATTSDHVPPKLLFPKPRASMLVVPACEICNNGFSRDDSYAQLVLSVDHKTGDHAAVEAIWPTVVRALNRVGHGGLLRQITGTLRPTWLQRTNGLVVPTGVFRADLSRLKTWTDRITRGLFRSHTGRRASIYSSVRSLWEEDLQELSPVDRAKIAVDALTAVMAQSEQAIQGGVFRYRIAVPQDDPWSAVILMTFYDRRSVLAVLQSPEARRAARDQTASGERAGPST